MAGEEDGEAGDICWLAPALLSANAFALCFSACRALADPGTEGNQRIFVMCFSLVRIG